MTSDPREMLRRPLEALPDPLPITPLQSPPVATVDVPGSKSLTNRLLLLAALSKGTSILRAPLRSDDCDRMCAALTTLGASIRLSDDQIEIDGVDGRFPAGGAVDLGDGGTPARFMLAAACLASETVVIDGSARLRERPMAQGLALLGALGANVESINGDGHLPVRVRPATISASAVRTGATQSSQFISALMLIAPTLPHGLDIHCTEPPTSEPYLSLTVAALQQWGVVCDVARSDQGDINRITIPPTQLTSRTVTVAPDASSAVPWWCIAAIFPDARIQTPGLCAAPPQPDEQALTFLSAIGCDVQTDAQGTRVSYGTPDNTGQRQEHDLSGCPDAAMSLAVAASIRGTSVRLTGLHTLRVKECDRIHALHQELTGLGCEVVEHAESIDIIRRPGVLKRSSISTYNDHRVAMAFAAIGLREPGISICDPSCVAKSYPGFWSDLAALYG